MVKVALLIGVSEYGSGLNPLPGAVKTVEAMQQLLLPSEISGFDEVKLLSNPNPPVMREAIETLFSGRTKNDLVLLLFSGHLVQDDSSELYFATSITSKSPRAELIRVSAIPISFVHDLMSNSPSQRQVVILDCCFNSISAQEMAANDVSFADIKTQLSGEGRAILSSLTCNQNLFESKDVDHSVYGRYLVEGIKTGAADLDANGWISADELHEYASSRVQVAAPAVKPEFYSVQDKYKILLFKAPIDNPKLKYRKEIENWVKRGEISEVGRYTLDNLAESLQLTSQECAAIEAEVLKPYQEYQEKLQRYKREFAKVISNDYPLNTQDREKLKGVQQILGLRDEDVASIEGQMALKLGNLSNSEDEPAQPTESETKKELNSVPSMLAVVLPDDVPTPTLEPANSTPASKNEAHDPAQSEIRGELNLVSSTPSVVQPEGTPIPALAPTNPTPAGNLSSSLASSQTTSGSATFPNKFLIPIAIGGVFAVMALAIGISTRTQVAPPTTSVDRVSASPSSSPTPSPTVQTSNPEPSPSPSASPESKVCTVFVNGNLRSEPAGFRENVVESLKETLTVTGKQTEGGWVEVKLPDNKLAWVYRDIIANEEDMRACLTKKGIKIKTIEDIPVPPSSSSSQSENF